MKIWMMYRFIVKSIEMKAFLFGLVFFCCSIAVAQAQRAADNYMNYCSGCHGQKLEGGRAPSLVIAPWKYGATRKSIIQNISKGIPGTEMIAWQSMLTSKQIEELADYMLSLKKKKPKS